MPSTQAPSEIADALLAWYDRARRDLPWRAKPGEIADPYRVWLSEVMLQQTTVAAVGPRFQRFLARWSTVRDLAAAPDDAVMAEWAGLGYYARARNLLKCARTVTERHDGAFPADEAALAALPGVGAYTSAAIAAIAFNRIATPVDGNIERVTARVFRIETPLPQAKPAIKAASVSMTPEDRPGDFAQAMMDLGATVCLPRRPRCLVCPLAHFCAALAAGVAADLPLKAPKPEKPLRQGTVYWATRPDGAVLLRRRAPKGLLGGMVELPSFGWSDDDAPEAVRQAAPIWRDAGATVGHVFTHFRLELTLKLGEANGKPAPDGCYFERLGDPAAHGLPSLMQKAARLAAKSG